MIIRERIYFILYINLWCYNHQSVRNCYETYKLRATSLLFLEVALFCITWLIFKINTKSWNNIKSIVVASNMDALNTVTEIIQVYQKCTSSCVCHWWTDEPFMKWATKRQKQPQYSTVQYWIRISFILVFWLVTIQSNPTC